MITLLNRVITTDNERTYVLVDKGVPRGPPGPKKDKETNEMEDILVKVLTFHL